MLSTKLTALKEKDIWIINCYYSGSKFQVHGSRLKSFEGKAFYGFGFNLHYSFG